MSEKRSAYQAVATVLVAVLALSEPKYYDQFSDLEILALAYFPQSDKVQKFCQNHHHDH